MNQVGTVEAKQARVHSAMRGRQLSVPLLVIVSLGLWLVFLKMTWPDVAQGLYDFHAYWNGGQALLHNLDPYRSAPFVQGAPPFLYAPIFATVMLPFTALPLPTADFVWYFFTLALVGIGCASIVSLVGWPSSILPSRVLAFLTLTVLAFFFYPVWTDAKLGQVSGMVLCFVVTSLLAHAKKHSFAAGTLLGIASALKLTPLPLIAFAIFIGWRRFGSYSLTTFLALMLLPASFAPDQFTEFWLKVAPNIGPLNEGINISTTALAARLVPQFSSALWPAAAFVSVSVVLIPFALAPRARQVQPRIELFALLLIGLVIAGPVTHNHYMIWLLLPIWILFTQFIQQRQLIGLLSLGGIFVLLSQPFRLLRILQMVGPFDFSAEAYGGAVLQLGALLLYLLLLATILMRRVAERAISSAPRTAAMDSANPSTTILASENRRSA